MALSVGVGVMLVAEALVLLILDSIVPSMVISTGGDWVFNL